MATLEKKRKANTPVLSRTLFPDLFDFDRFFDFDFPPVRKIAQVPMVNVKEGKNLFTLEMAAPGMKKSDFDIEIDNNLLIISFEKEEEKKETDEMYTRKEYSFDSFSRSFTLPDSVDESKIKARYIDGVLKLELPKKEGFIKELKAKHIAVN